MTDYVRQVQISFEAEDNTAAGIASVDKSIGTASQQAQMSARRMAQGFHILSDAIGGTAGRAISFGASVVQMMGSVNPLERAIHLAALGIRGITEAIQFFNQEAAEFRKRIDSVIESVNGLIKANAEFIKQKQIELLGLDEFGRKNFENAAKLTEIQKARSEADARIAELEQKRGVTALFSESELIGLKKSRLILLAQEKTLLLETQKIEATGIVSRAREERIAAEAGIGAGPRAEREKATWGVPGGAEQGFGPFGFMFGEQQQLIAAQAAEYNKEIEIDYQSFLANSRAEQFAMEESWRQEDLRAAEDYQRQKIAQIQQYGAIAKNVMGVLNVAADLGIKNEKARHAVSIALTLIDAGIKSAMEFAEGWATLSNPPISIGHFTAAALYAAIGVGKAFGGGATGARGGAGSAYERSTAQGGAFEDRGPQKSEVTIYINGERAGTAGFGKIVVDSIDAHLDRQNPGRQRKQVMP